jgi:hypothetical protein
MKAVVWHDAGVSVPKATYSVSAEKLTACGMICQDGTSAHD